MQWMRIGLAVCLCAISGWAHASENPGLLSAAREMREHVGDHRLILLGEKHGTREIPQLVESLVVAYSEQGPVLLALEVWRSEHEALRRYIESTGDARARAALEASPFWQAGSDQHDGRRNRDTLDLIDAVRRLKAAGRDVAVLPFDAVADHGRDHHWRDRFMAEQIRTAYEALPAGRLLVLAGNVHAMQQRPGFAPPQMQKPMGAYLDDLDPYAIDIVATRGEFWACLDSACGPMPVSPQRLGIRPVRTGTYDLRVALEQFSVARLLGRGASP